MQTVLFAVISYVGPKFDEVRKISELIRRTPSINRVEVLITSQKGMDDEKGEELQEGQRLGLLPQKIGVLELPEVMEALKKIKEASPALVINASVLPNVEWSFENLFIELLKWLNSHISSDDEDFLIDVRTGSALVRTILGHLAMSGIFPAKIYATNTLNHHSSFDPSALSQQPQIKQLIAQFHKAIPKVREVFPDFKEYFPELEEWIARVAKNSRSPVLITGPTGAGKSLLAKKISEIRKLEGKFKHFNCATFSGAVLQSTLFGHKRGAFTGATQDHPGLIKEADGGILFLDEIGDLPLDSQAMFLTLLDTGSYRPLGATEDEASKFQLICATLRNLEEEIANGRFREDLYERISVLPIEIPSLRNRKQSIESFFNNIFKEIASEYDAPIEFRKEAKEHYLDFAKSENATWPGNFRELNNSMRRLFVYADPEDSTSSHSRQTRYISLSSAQEETRRLDAKWQQKSRRTYLNISATSATSDSVGLEIVSQAFAEKFTHWSPAEKENIGIAMKVVDGARSKAVASRKLFNDPNLSNATSRLDDHLQRFSLSYNEFVDGLHKVGMRAPKPGKAKSEKYD